MEKLHVEVGGSTRIHCVRSWKAGRAPGAQAASVLGTASVVMWGVTQQLQKAKGMAGR